MNTTESNVLIANFMKLDIGHGDMVIDKWSENSPINNVWTKMKFHTSWDWLMPVVVECFNRYDEKLDGWGTGLDNEQFKLNDALLETNIDSLYKAVINYINWYNSQDYAAALEQDEQRYSDSLNY